LGGGGRAFKDGRGRAGKLGGGRDVTAATCAVAADVLGLEIFCSVIPSLRPGKVKKSTHNQPGQNTINQYQYTVYIYIYRYASRLVLHLPVPLYILYLRN
jgi:hypothetical protein